MKKMKTISQFSQKAKFNVPSALRAQCLMTCEFDPHDYSTVTGYVGDTLHIDSTENRHCLDN